MITPDDLVAAARHSRTALTPHADSTRWDAKAGELEWSCRTTVDHLSNALLFYAGQLSRRATDRLPRLREGNPAQTPAQLLDCLESSAAVLADVCRAAPPGTRAWHPAGMADAEGFRGMACVEILVHTDDIAATLSPASYRGPDDLTRRVIQRLFPWAPDGADPWALFRWCAGRAALPTHARQGPDWHWWCAPLAEWDGDLRVRTTPPGWR